MARATIADMKTHDWVGHAAGPILSTFKAKLEPLLQRPDIRDVRWIGAAAAIEFADTDGNPDPKARQRVQARCLDRRLLVYGGGLHKNTILLLPPININVDTLGNALEEVVAAIE